MSWLKDVIVDIAVTLFIAAAVLLDDPWMQIVIWIYTGIMLFTKGFVLFGDSYLQLINKAKTEAPDWFSHLLYAANTILLIYFLWWYAAVGWALIWMFSVLTQKKLNAMKSGKASGNE